MTDKIYLGLLILLLIIVVFGDINIAEHMGKVKDKMVKHVKKAAKYIIVNKHGKPHKIPVDFEIDPTGDYDVVSKALDIAGKAGKSDTSVKKQ